MMSNNSDNFKDFFKDTTSNIIILVSATLFIVFYIILKSVDINNTSGIITLQILSLISMISLIISIFKKFIPTSESNGPSIFEKIIVFLSFLYNMIPKLYSSDSSSSYKSALFIGIIVLISILLSGFFMKEIVEENYRNYGMILFNVLIFIAFIYFIYGIKKFFFDPKSQTFEAYSTFEYFLYYYLFPICFFIGYILYYVYIYRNENLSYTDFTDYRVIIFNILTGIIGLYLIYQLIIKNLLSSTTDSSIIHFIQSVFKVIPCILTVLFDYLIKNPSTAILSIGISTFFIFLMTLMTGSIDYNSWYMILLYIIGIIMFIAGIIKILLATTKFGETKVFQLLQKTIFALPCLFLLGIDKAFITQKFGTIPEFLFIILMIFFIFFYNSITTAIIPDLYEKYILNNGKQIIDNPIPLSKYTFISSYENLFNFNDTQSQDNKDNPNKFDYKYGLSFWIYLDSFSPLNSQLYDICSLGDGLIIKYNSLENALYFMYNGVNAKNMIEYNKKNKEKFENKKNLTIEGLNRWNLYKRKQNNMKEFFSKKKFEGFKNNVEETMKGTMEEIIEEPKEIIIHKEFGVLLQKWNNIIINYYGGTLDIFINGKLIKTKINVVPYINNTTLTIGKNDGINGDICNLIYYKSPMSKTDIYRMYYLFKNKNPPVINKSDTNIMNFGETLEIYFNELLTKTDKDNQNY